MSGQAQSAPKASAETVRRMESGLHALRTSGAMIAATFLAGGVALPLASAPEGPLAAIATTGFWALVVVLMTWGSPHLLALAGDAPLLIGTALLLGLTFTNHLLDDELYGRFDPPGAPLQMLVVGALLLGAATGALAGVLLHVYGLVTPELEGSGPLFAAGLAIVLGVLIALAPAASPIAVPVAILALFIARSRAEWPTGFYVSEAPAVESLRHAVQLCIVLVAAGASLAPGLRRER